MNTHISESSEYKTESFLLPGIKDKVFVVTAGANGIGLAISQVLTSLGAHVAICDIDHDALDVAATLPNLYAVKADVSNPLEVHNFFSAIKSKFGLIDGLVNNAGIPGPTSSVEAIDPADWQKCIDICLTGQFLCAREAIPSLKENGGGSIVAMASAAGKFGYAYRTPYSAAKFGVIGLAQSLAKELGPFNIRVNAVLPGIVEGPRMEKVIEDRADASGVSVDEMRNEYLRNISLRRMVSPFDVARTVAFLMSDTGRNLSGLSMTVDGNVETL